jgi:hypothetical protein
MVDFGAMEAKRKNPAAVALGRLGGKVGGKAQVPKGFSALTPEERKANASAAAKARWGPKKKAPKEKAKK